MQHVLSQTGGICLSKVTHRSFAGENGRHDEFILIRKKCGTVKEYPFDFLFLS